MHALIRFVVLWMVSTSTMAEIRLSIDRLSNSEVAVQGLKLIVNEAPSGQDAMPEAVGVVASQFTITAQEVHWPKHDTIIHGLRLGCSNFLIDRSSAQCKQGQLHIPLPWFDDPDIIWSAKLETAPILELDAVIKQLGLAGGRLNLDVHWQPSNDVWSFASKGNRLSLQRIAGWIPTDEYAAAYEVTSGKLSYDAKAQGQGIPNWERPNGSAQVRIQMTDFAGAHADGLKAAEGVSAEVRLSKSSAAVPASIEFELTDGGVYIDPWFVDLGAQPIQLSTRLQTSPSHRLRFSDVRLEQRQLGVAEGSMVFRYGKQRELDQFKLDRVSVALEPFNQTYVAPLLIASSWEGLTMRGGLEFNAQGHGTNLNDLVGSLTARDVMIDDPKGRLSIENLSTEVNWRNKQGASQIQWSSARLFNIGLGTLNADFQISEQEIRFTPFELPVLDGGLQVEEMRLSGLAGESPRWQFEGYLAPISMQELSTALGWAPMEGTLSAVIPSINYENGTLDVGGTLLARLFDGQILLRHLSAQGLLSDYPMVATDIQLTNLDLGSLTRQFSFGSIEGRLEGRIEGLMLENWQPVAFDAWLGTPEGDRSPHRISQKAIENISDLGGVGVAGALSRGFMRFFDTFRYRRIGIGCTLSNGICHVHGVTPAGTGYYLVEGGGLPRIDIIGHNRQILWRVFLQRLERVLASSAPATQEE